MVLVIAAAAFGAGLWLSALNVKYRDVRNVTPFLVQFWMFASPVLYPASVIPEKLRMVFSLNPMVGPIEAFRWAVLGTQIDPWPMMLMSSISAIVILISGAIYFQTSERSFADLI
jgi:lipopolysaccharide transport system permease protein